MIERYTPKDMAELWSEESRFQAWLDVELAVLWAKEKLGQIKPGIHRAIKSRASFTVKAINQRDREIEHDLQAFVDVVRQSLGDLVHYFHEDMTSYDVVDPALSVLLVRAGLLVQTRMDRLLGNLKWQADRHKLTLKIGRTHGVHAEPITFGFEVLNWYDQVDQAGQLVTRAFSQAAVGKCSGALGTYTLSPELERLACQRLSVEPPKITTQINPRLLHANLLSAIAILASVLDKIDQDIRNMQRTEVGELEEPRKKKQKGSSAMPHKKNPVICERMTGLARVLRNNAGVGFENVVTWDSRDIAQSSAERIVLVDSTTLIAYMLDKMCWVIEGLVVNQKRMEQNLGLTRGVIYSQDVKTLAAQRAQERQIEIAPDQVYEYVQGCAFAAMEQSKPFASVLWDTPLPNGLPLSSLMDKEDLRVLFDPWRKLKHLPAVFKRFGIELGIPEG